MRRPELLEETALYSDVRLASGGAPLTVTLSATDGLLCTARLPAAITDDELQRTAEMFGPVRFAFVLRSEATGEARGGGVCTAADGPGSCGKWRAPTVRGEVAVGVP